MLYIVASSVSSALLWAASHLARILGSMVQAFARLPEIGPLLPALAAVLAGGLIFSGMGMGGGLVYRPTLLLLGWTDHMAVATSCILTTTSGVVAGLVFSKFKLADVRLVAYMGPLAAAGSLVGGLTAPRAPEIWLSAFTVVCLWIALALQWVFAGRGKSVTRRRWGTRQRTVGASSYTVWIPGLVSAAAAAGFSGAWMGIGGGLILVPVMIGPCGIPAKIAVATSSLMVIVVGSTAFLGHMVGGSFAGAAVLLLIPAVALGAGLGALVSVKLSQRTIERLVAATCLLVSLYFLWRTIRLLSSL